MIPRGRLARAAQLKRIAASYFFYAGRPHMLNPIHYARVVNENRVRARLSSDYPELCEVIQAMAPSGSTGCDFSDYWELYRWIRRHSPLWVLECGSGVSSGVIAAALAENGRGRLVSLDESRSYQAQASTRLPARLKTWVEFHYSDVAFQRYAGVQGIFYREVPQHPYDFVFVDGPAGPPRTAADEKPFNSDFINILLNTPDRPVAAMIDQRITTLWAYRRLLPTAHIRYYVTKRLTYVVAKRGNLASTLLTSDGRC